MTARDALRREARALFDRHACSDETERSHRARMLALLDSPGDPFDRAHFGGPAAAAAQGYGGHFTASAFVLSPERDALLLILHGKLQRWFQPGGHFEPEDGSLAEAAARELAEETGVGPAILVGPPRLFDLDVHPIPARADQPLHAHFDVRFLFQAGERRAHAASDALALKWVSLPEAAQLWAKDAALERCLAKLR